MQPVKAATVEDREQEIFRYLKQPEHLDRGATVREIWEAVPARLARRGVEDEVTQQAYYKLLDRLATVGKLDCVNDPATDGGRRYLVAPHLTAENALTLDDVYELLDELEPSDAIARVIDAREYFEERRASTLTRAAEALLEEDPLELVHAFVVAKVRELQADLELLHHRDEGEPLADRELEARVDAQFRELHLLAYRYLGLSRAAVDAARPEQIKGGRAALFLEEAELRRELELRVFGERVIMPIDVPAVTDPDEWQRVTVSGSDGSSHASVLQLATAPAFIDDMGNEVVTFNNSVVYVHAAPVFRRRIEYPYYSVPMSRESIDHRGNRGMVLAPFMFRYLDPSEYEHMAKCATDVVQWRADELVFRGTARSLADGKLLPRPMVHFRDGTITPQEREFNHYQRANEYGEMVQEGIALSRRILEQIIVSDRPPVFAGAVKATQQHFFSMLLNWYIARGSRERFGAPLDPKWDTTRAAHIADNEAMSYLLSTLTDRRRDGMYYVTFAVARPFHTLTEYYNVPRTSEHSWVEHFERLRDLQQGRYQAELDNEVPYLVTVADLTDENYVFMCRKADYVAFYVGHTAGEPPPIVPRYEFLESLRPMAGVDAARDRVARNQRLVVAALHHTKFHPDREHNFLSRKFLVRIIPYVVYQAHEKCKALGRKLESELRSIVVANLQALRNARSLRPSDVQFRPVTIRRFVERYWQFTRGEDGEDPGRNDR
jgi:hypothetical protein